MVDGYIERIVVFFFKQKTAYEMRISDWSSDVCSSDLGASDEFPNLAEVPTEPRAHSAPEERAAIIEELAEDRSEATFTETEPLETRSEEHTSELQSLMRISYAVFCLKKKKPQTNASKPTHTMDNTNT